MNNEELLRKLNESEKELEIANNIIIDLETKITEMISLSSLSGSEKIMLDIIEREIKRIDLNTKDEKMSKDDLRKFDTLIKDFVAIRGKIIPEKIKDNEIKEENIDNLISIVKSS